MKIQNSKTRLIVAASETDPDMLYATNFWAPDPFIFLERNGKRTLVLSDLEIDRGRKQAKADEFVMFSELEREALLLVAWDGLASDDAAEVLGISPATFRKRVSRARQSVLAAESSQETAAMTIGSEDGR